ncbi:hypothetical protein FOXB_15479 [Fusarium oxysporum f. sp. conglutinans Fo5176]|uniref:Uncharacterized protein n=1 Tax=Fusarium oxysporum (strain Fo5176) TaxID=660025 RepID=F9G9Z8_FUSOF|nr:hypothetical protein FOXB_15479 [Fusarium oxysporum f. sp. conglutinans Fo5176]
MLYSYVTISLATYLTALLPHQASRVPYQPIRAPSASRRSTHQRKRSYLLTRIDEINRSLAAQVSSNQSSDLQIPSDAAFADDPLTRKSSQGPILFLFGGLVSWKAGKQDTVTTSSTEAELLAFSHIAKQAIVTKRLFDQLDLQLDQLPIIEYGNEQTIRLILLDAPRIKTAIKHIDVHNCWARQAYQGGSSEVQFTPTAQMVADGLIKALSARKFQTFNRQLGLTDIRSLIELQDKSDLEDN